MIRFDHIDQVTKAFTGDYFLNENLFLKFNCFSFFNISYKIEKYDTKYEGRFYFALNFI